MLQTDLQTAAASTGLRHEPAAHRRTLKAAATFWYQNVPVMAQLAEQLRIAETNQTIAQWNDDVNGT